MTLVKVFLRVIQTEETYTGQKQALLILVEQGHQTWLVLGNAEIHQLEDSHRIQVMDHM